MRDASHSHGSMTEASQRWMSPWGAPEKESVVVNDSLRSQTSGPTETKRSILRQYAGVLVTIVVLAVTGATVLTFSAWARHQLALSFVRQPTHYTVLYADALTQGIPNPDLVTLTVSFTVVNREGKATRFPYGVQVVDHAETPVGRTAGSLEVADGSDATATVTVNVPASAAWSAVEVNLEGRVERIRLLQSPPEATGN